MSQEENNLDSNTTTNNTTTNNTTTNNTQTNIESSLKTISQDKVDNTTHFRARNININFIKELFKKNAILYIALLFAIPAMALLSTISSNGAGYYDRSNAVCDVNELLPFTFFIIFVIPAVLSLTLFSWVYKRKKVDFICSMPINRRTMCISTTILGVLFITVLSIVYILSIKLGCIMSGKEVFVLQLIDTFIYMLLSMLFLFGIYNLAMSRAGNIITQCVLTILLLFFIPLFAYCFKEAGNERSYSILGEYETPIYLYSSENQADYLPMPMNTVFAEKTLYISIYKITQSLVYIAVVYLLTQILFEHRKMEENQESFKSTLIHEIVKVLGMIIPVSILAYQVFDDNLETPTILIFVIISIVAFVIYDLITSKKVSLKISIITFVSAYLISGVFGFVLFQLDANANTEDERTLSVNSINTIYIEVPCTEGWFEITDKSCIDNYMNYVLYKSNNTSIWQSVDYNENSYTDSEIESYEDEDMYKYDTNNNKSSQNTKKKYVVKDQKTIRLSYKIKFDNNKTFKSRTVTINQEDFNKIFANYLDTLKQKAIEDIRYSSDYWEKSDDVKYMQRNLVGDSLAYSKKTKSPIVDIGTIINTMNSKSAFDLYKSIDYNNGNHTKNYLYNGYYYHDFEIIRVELVDFY